MQERNPSDKYSHLRATVGSTFRQLTEQGLGQVDGCHGVTLNVTSSATAAMVKNRSKTTSAMRLGSESGRGISEPLL